MSVCRTCCYHRDVINIKTYCRQCKMAENSSLCNTSDDEIVQVTYIGIVLCFIIISESLLTVVTILRSPVLHTNQYIFIVSLSFSDILLAVSSAGVRTFRSSATRWLPPNSFVNMLFFVLNSASVTITGLHMGVIAIDRYVRIVHPFYYIQHARAQVICKILACVWLACTIDIIVPLVLYRERPCSTPQFPLEYCTTNGLVTLANMAVVCICYSKVARIAIKNRNSAAARRLQNDDNNGVIVFRNNNLTVMKSVKYFVTTCGIYIVCTLLPFLINAANLVFKIPVVINTVTSFSFPIHSVLNLFILCIMYKQFFTALKKILAGVWVGFCCCRRGSVHKYRY